jgi:hypothetical protein
MSLKLTKKLFLALLNGEEENAIRYINKGAYIQCTSPLNDVPLITGVSALHLAADKGLAKVTQALINAGHIIDVTDPRGCTPLHHAATQGHLEVLELLISANANCILQNHEGETALHLAVKHEHLENVKCLMEERPQLLFIQDNKEITPYHIAGGNIARYLSAKCKASGLTPPAEESSSAEEFRNRPASPYPVPEKGCLLKLIAEFEINQQAKKLEYQAFLDVDSLTNKPPQYQLHCNEIRENKIPSGLSSSERISDTIALANDLRGLQLSIR